MEIKRNVLIHSHFISYSITHLQIILMIGSSDIHIVSLLIVTKIVGHTSVWIVGSSIIRNASEYAFVNYGNHHLNLKPHNISVRWFGKGGMI